MSDADEIAEAVLAKLREHVIPATYPAEVGQWLRDATAGHPYQWSFIMPLKGPEHVNWRMVATPTGALDIEACDSTGETFWRGTLRPVSDG